MRLENKVAIITGAGSGIGRASALRFAAEGAYVLAVDVNEEGLDETGQLIANAGLAVPSTYAADVSQSVEVKAAVEKCFSDYGRIDVVFSNAAVMLEGSAVDLPEEDWDTMFRVNVKGAFLLAKYAIPVMASGRGGSFIITASANSYYAESDIAGYCATKGAAMQLTRAMAIDHGPEGVRVNCICPGWIETPMSLPFLTEVPDGRDFANRIAPMGRVGQPEDVASVAVFLASDESSFVSGSAYAVDGGWTSGMTKAIALI